MAHVQQVEPARPGPAGPKVAVEHYRVRGPSGIGTEAYRGLNVFAYPGLHAFCAGLLRERVPPGSEVLELGAGSGAMSLRLADLGYRPTAVDVVAENFLAGDHARFVRADLNGDFATGLGPFPGVMALEIIEHLENPRHFLRQVRACLEPGGHLVLSTPNLSNPLSRVRFMIDGTYQWFDDRNYETSGHITPLSPWQLSHCFEDCGLAPEWIGSFGDVGKNLAGWPRMRWLVRTMQPLSRIPTTLDGEIYVAVLRAA